MILESTVVLLPIFSDISFHTYTVALPFVAAFHNSICGKRLNNKLIANPVRKPKPPPLLIS